MTAEQYAILQWSAQQASAHAWIIELAEYVRQQQEQPDAELLDDDYCPF